MTPPVSTVIQTVADGLADLLDGLAPELWTPIADAGGCAWTPRDLDQLPAAVVELPTVRLTEPDELDPVAIGSMGMLLEYPVTFYFELNEAYRVQSEAVAYVEAAMLAIRFDPSMGVAGVIDSSMVAAQPVIVEDRVRTMIAYECTVQVLMSTPDPDP